ncbi:MAG: bestrophin family ion channel [Flavobacteriales bacterium]
MVHYNPKDWFGLIFKFHKSDTFRKLFWVILSLAIYSFFIVFLELRVFHSGFKTTTSVHSLLGFVISLLLVFRTNTAYDRWWEGRKQWGALVNVSRNFALKIKAFIPDSDHELKNRLFDADATYATILKDHLRNAPAEKLASCIPSEIKIRNLNHIPNALANAIQDLLLEAFKKHEISQAAYLAMLNDVNAFTDICGACERIKKTPIPYTYNIFIKKFIFVYIITMPFAFISDFGYWSVLVTIFTFYTLASLELIAETIEDPFGLDPDDLPTDELATTIYNNVQEIKNSQNGI